MERGRKTEEEGGGIDGTARASRGLPLAQVARPSRASRSAEISVSGSTSDSLSLPLSGPDIV